VHAFNPERGKIATPNMDKLASEGMSFTDAHSSSAVCTPSRYSILTGRYNWRSRLQSGVLNGMSEPLIAPGRMTVASLLKERGYSTACIGKWHLGLGYPANKFESPLTDGPLQHGFGHFFGIAASLDMPPFAWIEDDHFPEKPTATKRWVRSGPAAPSFEAIDVLPTLAKKAGDYIQSHNADRNDGKPFFLYLTFTAPHTPILPTKQFKGKSGLNIYADFVMETDWALGEVLKALNESGQRQNTLVFFTSDNGCSPAAKPQELEAKGHFPSAQFRGYKADIWDGGHRIPMIVRWPGVVKEGTKSGQLVGLIDLLATTAEIEQAKLPDNSAEDSFSILPILKGADAPVRKFEIHHSIDGYFAIREGNWKLELCAGSGGWGSPREAQAAAEKLPKVQLYDLSDDIGEKRNLEKERPEIVERLTKELKQAIADGRTTPGERQKNDVAIEVYKKPKRPATRAEGD
jgi:arylsulfatase A